MEGRIIAGVKWYGMSAHTWCSLVLLLVLLRSLHPNTQGHTRASNRHRVVANAAGSRGEGNSLHPCSICGLCVRPNNVILRALPCDTPSPLPPPPQTPPPIHPRPPHPPHPPQSLAGPHLFAAGNCRGRVANQQQKTRVGRLYRQLLRCTNRRVMWGDPATHTPQPCNPEASTLLHTPPQRPLNKHPHHKPVPDQPAHRTKGSTGPHDTKQARRDKKDGWRRTSRV